jgi:PTS system mannose-specific IIA component
MMSRFAEALSLIGALIVTHGNLATELLKAAQQIEADVAGIEAVALEWNDTVDAARDKIRAALDRMSSRQGVIIFTDMFGGTPSNLSLSFLEEGRVEVITGVNLPMVVKFATVKQDSKDVASLAHVISEKGARAIRVASGFLTGSTTRAGAQSIP